MSLAYYIVLDKENPGFETFVNGKAVAHAAEALDGVCDELGLPPLDSFMGESLAEIGELLGMDLEPDEDDDGEAEEGVDGEAQWFDPVHGLALFEGLIAHLEQHPGVLGAATAGVLEDLVEYRTVLEQAQQAGARWHLAVDL